MNILLLHAMGKTAKFLSSTKELELMFPSYDKENEYIVFDTNISILKCIKSFEFDAI